MKKLIRRLTRWAWRSEIATCDGLAELKALNMDGGKMELRIESDPNLALWQAKCFASMVEKSPNYTELKFDLAGEFKGKYEWITVLVQKGNGKTPHQLRAEAEVKLAEAKIKLASLDDVLMRIACDTSDPQTRKDALGAAAAGVTLGGV